MTAAVRASVCLTLIVLCCLLAILPEVHAEDAVPPSAVGPVLKLFQSGKLPPARLPAVVEMICTRGNEHDLRVVYDQALKSDGFPTDLRIKAMGWLTDAATTRKVKPTGSLSSIDQFVTDKNSKLQLAAIRLASVWKEAAISKALQALLADEKAPPELQLAAIEGLAAVGDAGSQETLMKLAGSARPISLRTNAVAGLVALDAKVAAVQAAKVLGAATPQDDFGAMLDAFFNRKEGADLLAAALKEQTLAKDVAKTALRYMYSVGRSDAELSAVLSEAAGVASDPVPPTPAEVAELVNEVIAKGNAARGEKIFRRADVSCMRCHSVSRAGGQVGPELSALGGSSPVDYVVNSILNPNLAVKEQYVTKIFALANGTALTGVVIDRDENRVRIRDAQNKTVIIPRADIEEEVEGKSLMPQGLTKFLTHEEVIDLAKFVSELGKPGEYEIRKIPTIQRWRLMVKPPAELTDEVPHLEHIRQHVLDSEPTQWASVYGKVGGGLPLAELRAGNTPTVKILQGEIQVNEAGKVAFKIGCTERLQAWVDAEAFETQREFELALEPGRHTLTIRVEVSDHEAPELKIEVTKPEGSTAQFEVVGGS